MRSLPFLVLAVALAACSGSAPSPVPWGDFQSRVLDVQDRYKATPDITDDSIVTFLDEQRTWAAGVTADACYDPALRAFRSYLDDLHTAYSKIAGRELSTVPLADLQASRDALESAKSSVVQLDQAMVVATDVCNR